MDTFSSWANTPEGNKIIAADKMVKFLKIRLFRSFLLNKNVNFVIFIVDNVLMYFMASWILLSVSLFCASLLVFSMMFCSGDTS